ncbi:uncharacterized protein METZ01_LOCUS473222, partial [marine metagenome]
LSLLLHEHAAAGNADELAELMIRHVIPIYDFRARQKGYEVSAMKTLMNLTGQVGGKVRPPLPEVRESEIPILREMAEAWEALL